MESITVAQLRKMAQDNIDFVSELEAGRHDVGDKRDTLIRTYRFWANCLSFVAFLVEQQHDG
jgi:hypothetical protein